MRFGRPSTSLIREYVRRWRCRPLWITLPANLFTPQVVFSHIETWHSISLNRRRMPQIEKWVKQSKTIFNPEKLYFKRIPMFLLEHSSQRKKEENAWQTGNYWKIDIYPILTFYNATTMKYTRQENFSKNWILTISLPERWSSLWNGLLLLLPDTFLAVSLMLTGHPAFSGWPPTSLRLQQAARILR